MAWRTPKTDWKAGDIPAASDFNRIEGDTLYLKDEVDSHKAEDASTTAKGHVQLNNTVTSTSTTQAATANAVKTVNDALTSHKTAAAPHSGHETPAGAQAKANAAEANAKGYTDTHAGTKNTHGVGSGYYIAKTSRSDQLPAWNDVQGKPSNFTPSAHKSTHASGGSDALTPSDIGAETPAGAQAKANAAEARAKAYTDQEVAEVSQALDAHLADLECLIWMGGI